MSYLKKALIALSIVVLASCDTSSPTAVGSIQIDPPNASLQPGQSSQMVAVGENGATITDGVSWTSSDPARASITSTGMVTGGYGSGTATITARVSSASATAVVDVLRICVVQAAVSGSPDPGVEIQSFDVAFDSGTDGVKRANELAARLGFRLIEARADGFSATLTPAQAAAVACAVDVAGLTFL